MQASSRIERRGAFPAPKNSMPTPKHSLPPQLNIAIVVDVNNTLQTGTLEGHAFLTDNSPDTVNKGGETLETVCVQGQMLNWLVFCLNMDKLPNGSWPPFARIVNIVFLDNNGDAEMESIMMGLQIYGGPDAVPRPGTASYYYWAGLLPSNITPGTYRYRLVMEVDTYQFQVKQYYQIPNLSLKVLPLDL
jgi:hypothetical protein